jgi:hypothetical protein
MRILSICEIKLTAHHLQEPITYQKRRFWTWHKVCLIEKVNMALVASVMGEEEFWEHQRPDGLSMSSQDRRARCFVRVGLDGLQVKRNLNLVR